MRLADEIRVRRIDAGGPASNGGPGSGNYDHKGGGGTSTKKYDPTGKTGFGYRSALHDQAGSVAKSAINHVYDRPNQKKMIDMHNDLVHGKDITPDHMADLREVTHKLQDLFPEDVKQKYEGTANSLKNLHQTLSDAGYKTVPVRPDDWFTKKANFAESQKKAK